MFWFNLFLTGLAAYFAKEEYDRGRIGWAMVWAALLGWDLHSLLAVL